MGTEDKPPSYQWYPRDFRAEPAVDAMTFDQRGRYQWALDASWLTESYGVAPPDQWRQWMHYSEAEWSTAQAVFMPCFKPSRDGLIWTQKRMVNERSRQVGRHNQAKMGGEITQAARRTSLAQHQHSTSTASSTAGTPASASASASASYSGSRLYSLTGERTAEVGTSTPLASEPERQKRTPHPKPICTRCDDAYDPPFADWHATYAGLCPTCVGMP